MVNVRYLLDTNVLSEPLRPRPNAGLMKRLRTHAGELATAAIVWHELLFGSERLPPSKKRAAIDEYLNGVVWPTIPILPYDAPAARWHARERARLAKAGETPAFADGQVAAIAAVNRLVVVSANVAHYLGFRGVNVEDWTRGG